MKRTVFLSVLALPFVVGTGIEFGDSNPRDDEAFLGDALGTGLVGASQLDSPDAAEAARLSEATGVKAAGFAQLRLWEALSKGDRVLRIAQRTLLPGSAGAERSVLFALSDEGEFVGAAVLDEGGNPLDEWKHFLDTFRFYEVPQMEGARPRAHLASAREAARKGKSEDERLTFSMLEMLVAMNEQASAFNLPQETKTRTPAEEALAMAAAYERVEELSDWLEPLLGKSKEVLVETALDSSDSAREMALAMEEGDMPLVQELRKHLISNCRKCHDLPLTNDRGPLKAGFPNIRREFGIGDGYYQIGHDIRIRHADQPRAQRVADALREAALALDLVSSR